MTTWVGNFTMEGMIARFSKQSIKPFPLEKFSLPKHVDCDNDHISNGSKEGIKQYSPSSVELPYLASY